MWGAPSLRTAKQPNFHSISSHFIPTILPKNPPKHRQKFTQLSNVRILNAMVRPPWVSMSHNFCWYSFCSSTIPIPKRDIPGRHACPGFRRPFPPPICWAGPRRCIHYRPWSLVNLTLRLGINGDWEASSISYHFRPYRSSGILWTVHWIQRFLVQPSTTSRWPLIPVNVGASTRWLDFQGGGNSMTRPVSTILDIIQRNALSRLARTDRISMAIDIAVNGSVWVESQSCSARQQWLGVRAEWPSVLSQGREIFDSIDWRNIRRYMCLISNQQNLCMNEM